MTKFLFLAMMAAAFTAGANDSTNACTRLGEVRGARLSRCEAGPGREEFLLLIPGKARDELELHALFSDETPKNSFYRLWEKTGTQRLSAKNQSALRLLLTNKGRGQLGERGFALVNFLANFAPAGFELRDYDLSRTRALRSPMVTFSMLCNKIGERHEGFFTVGRSRRTKIGVVGYPECLGRCGPGCAASGKVRDGQYTQECFNHDLCNRTTGENMGVCEDAFWEAADGFLNAPNCQ